MSRRRPKVLTAVSGGVDSAVAAALLLEAGYEVVGCFMRLGSPGDRLDELEPEGGRSIRIGHQGCCSINDAADARRVAVRLGIPLYVCNFRRDFGRIIDYFVDEYNAGRTPNPCVRCNDWLKFGKLHRYARQIGAEFVASGHHARIDRSDPGRPRLLRGRDRAKDQSYVLFGASPTRLGEMLLPIGEHEKRQVRKMARERDLPVHDKPDSQEICFVPDDDYTRLVRRRTPDRVASGPIVDTGGATLGEHPGHQHFTIGQRRGVGVALGHPIYVVDKDPVSNTITVGSRERLMAAGCRAQQVNWLLDPPREGDAWIRCSVKIRYNTEPVAARVRRIAGDTIEIRFDEPQFAVAPGQAAVCYEGEAVLGGGWISQALPRDGS